MNIAEIIGLLVKLAVFSTVFALGLDAAWKDVAYLPGRPRLFGRSILAMYILTPLIAVLLVLVVDAPFAVKAAVLLMAISAGAPALPKKLLKLSANAPYIRSLAVIAALLAIVTVPLSLTAMGTFLGRDVSVGFGHVAYTITTAFLAPLLAGMVVRSLAPVLADRLSEPIVAIAGVVQMALAALIVATNFSAIVDVGLPGLATIAIMTGVSLAVGHVLGGPDPNDRTVLAVACATRFPGLGLLVASLSFPNFKPLPIVVAYMVVSTLVVLPYIRWSKSRRIEPTAIEQAA